MTSELLTLEEDSLETVNRYFYERQWTDGLPIIPPTPERVAAMLRFTDLPQDHPLGRMPPRWRLTTVHHVAINAVMAGCRPEYFPVVIAGLQAALDPDFNLYGVQATTNPAGVMLLVNGPIASELDVNGGFNLFGPGWQANATIGRAVRLCLINCGGGIPGVGDMSTLGSPSKYTACIAENEPLSPWTPFHVERGYAADTSTVTAIASAAPQNVIEMSAEADAILDTLARALPSMGSNCLHFDHEPMVVLAPVQARHVAAGGYDRPAIRRFLWERGRIEITGFSRTTTYAISQWKSACIKEEGGKRHLYPTRTPEEIGVVVAGGDTGPHAAVLATFNGTKLVTRPIAFVDGRPVRSVQEFLR